MSCSLTASTELPPHFSQDCPGDVARYKTTYLSVAIRWLTTAHASSGSAFVFTPPLIKSMAWVVPTSARKDFSLNSSF